MVSLHDSPSANAQFVDMYQTMNADAQQEVRRTSGTDTANKYIQMARSNNPVNYEGIQKTLSGYYNDAMVSLYLVHAQELLQQSRCTSDAVYGRLRELPSTKHT